MTKAKSEKKKAAAANAKAKKQSQAIRIVRSPVLDKAAIDYANLLVDPCNGTVVHPIYPGADAGYLFRADTFSAVGSGALETAGILHWVPGYVNASNSEILIGGNAASGGNITLAAFASGPGKTFLAANASGVRCVAACLKITFAGAESARSGRIHFGHTTAGMLDVGQVATVDQVATALTNFTRTPPDTIEIIWKPSISDTEFNDPTAAASATLRDRKSAITVAFAGLPAAVGMTWHATAVYEWLPSSGIGVANNVTGKAKSRNTLDDVVDALINRGERFVRAVGHGAMDSVINAVTSTFGNMPSRSTQRLLAYG